jgi:hypothetical protein
MVSSSCSRGSIPNPRTGRCKACNNFKLDELKSIAKSQRVSQRGTKQEICKRLIKHFMRKVGKIRSVSRTTKSRTRTKSRTKRPVKRRTRSRSSSKKARRAPRRSSSYYRSKAPRVVKTRTRRGSRVRTYSYPTKGRGSFQKRHFSSKRKGPSLPANSHPWEVARGNDGFQWQSRPDKNGVFHWKRL